ncbi:MAG TPA: PLP-dependent aminotransferase family protein [Thermoanaerobaculia bacterium]|nr:PLP-dependent aminotransferase family protein [Thermoanaerobaculia bacterium]
MAGQLELANLNLDRGSREPLPDQLVAAIESRIAAGVLAGGVRLPTTRDLAVSLAINRGTVQAAYRKLAERGLIVSRVGSGTVVRENSPVSVDFDPARLLSRRALEVTPEAAAAIAPPVIADFSRLTPDERFFPLEEFVRTLSTALTRRPDLWQYAPPPGLPELRREIAGRLAEHGITRTPDEILVTSGAQQALDLIFRTFTDPGDTVALESPTYPGALALARFAGVEVLPLPVGAQGADASALFGRRAKFVYVMPERQNPTGVTASDASRRAILDGAAAAGALVVEDGYEEPESGLSPLAARDPSRTIWLGTLSKDLVPGFRIGWVAASAQVVDRLARIKKTADFQTPLPFQAAVAEFLRVGADRRARRNRALEVEARRIAAERALRTHLPEVAWSGGNIGDALFWLQLPPGVSGRRVSEAAAARGVGVAPGADFDPRGQDCPNIRLSVSRVDKRQVETGIRVLADAVRLVQSQSGIRAMPVV